METLIMEKMFLGSKKSKIRKGKESLSMREIDVQKKM